MSRKILLIIFVIGTLTVFLSWDAIITRPPKPANFPLRKIWINRLNESVLGLSLASQDILLARTSAALYALDTKNGNILWRYSLSRQADPKPAIADKENVYVADGRSLIVLSPANGIKLWEQSLPYPTGWVTDVSEGLVVVNQMGFDIMVYDVHTGAFLWRRPVCRGYVKAAISDQYIFIPCDDIKAVSRASGEAVWKENVSGTISSADYSDGVLYYYTDSVHAYDLQSQESLWSTPLARNGIESLKVLSGNLFYEDASQLCMLERENGHLVWCEKIPLPQKPTILGNLVYTFNGNHKEIRAFEIGTGHQIGTLELSNLNYFSVDRDILTSNENLLFFSSGRDVYAFGD